MLKRALVLVAAIVVFIVIFDAIFHNNPSRMGVVLGGKTFTADIADTQVTQEQGLSGRKTLANDAGMIFVFDTPDNYGFWMKDMNFPLDIVWISPDYKIVHMENSVTSSTYPKIYYPNASTQYVLEISAGQIKKLNVQIGDTVSFLKK